MGWGWGSTEQLIQQMHVEHSLCTRWAPVMCHACVNAGVWVEKATALPWPRAYGPLRTSQDPELRGLGGGSEAGGGGGRPGLWIPRVVAAPQGQCVIPPGGCGTWGRGFSLLCSLLVCLFIFLFIYFFNLFLGQRETEHERGEGQRERETQNRKQAPGSEPSAQSLTRGSNSRTARS